jgi:peptidylprolyl isomerase
MDRAKAGDHVRVQYFAPAKRGATAMRPGRTVLEFTVGSGEVIPGISLGVVGMAEGEKKQLVLQPQDAYGVVRRQLIKEIPRERFPGLDLRVGKRLATVNASGKRRRVKVLEIKPNSVVVDGNHPLAGKVLKLEIRLLSLQQSSANRDKPQQDLGGEG